MRKIAFLSLLLLACSTVFAQSEPVEMADAMYSSGRIYVVIATITIVFAALAVYLFTIDRRLKKIEREK